MINISRVPERGKVAATQSLNATFNGDPYLVERLSGYSMFIVYTESSASLAGTFKLQASNNAFKDNTSGELRSDATWVDVASSTQTLTAGSGAIMYNVPEAYYEAVRIVWTRTTGQGSAQVYFIAKE